MVWILNSEDESKAVQELVASSPRAAAIVGAAILENRIGDAVAAMFPVEGETKDKMFKPSGRLGDFDTKAKLAYMFGILSKPAFQDVGKIAEIRNKFAHRLEISSFTHSEIVPLSAELKLVEKHVFPQGTDTSDVNVSPKMYEQNLEDQLQDPQKRYLLTIRLITSAFWKPQTVGGGTQPQRKLFI